MIHFRKEIIKRDLLRYYFLRSSCKNQISRMHHCRKKLTFANSVFYSKCEKLQNFCENTYNSFLILRNILYIYQKYVNSIKKSYLKKNYYLLSISQKNILEIEKSLTRKQNLTFTD